MLMLLPPVDKMGFVVTGGAGGVCERGCVWGKFRDLHTGKGQSVLVLLVLCVRTHTHTHARGVFLPCRSRQAPGTARPGSRVPAGGWGVLPVLTFPAEVPALVRYCPVAGLHLSGALQPQTRKNQRGATLSFLDKQFYFR